MPNLNDTVPVVEQERIIKMFQTFQKYQKKKNYLRLNDRLPQCAEKQLAKIIEKCQGLAPPKSIDNFDAAVQWFKDLESGGMARLDIVNELLRRSRGGK